MQNSDDKLDRLLKDAFPEMEVSPDFTLRLWHRLMQPGRPPWMIPAPVLGMVAFMGILAGILTWTRILPNKSVAPIELSQIDRLDLFGNAPIDSVAGSYLRLIAENKG